MKKMYLLFSHLLTDEQVFDARETLKVEEFIYMPYELKYIWANIPPQLDILHDYLIPIKDFIKDDTSNSYVLIQGDFGAVYEMVNFAKSLGLIPIYATTKRDVIEEKHSNEVIKKSIFRHVRYRKY